MSLRLNVQIQGVREILDSFQSYRREIQPGVDENLGQAVDAVAVIAQQYAPVRTGRLRDSISSEQTGPMSYALSAEAPYALYVEYGTIRMPAQPFMRPGVMEGRQLILDSIFQAIQEAFGG